MEKVCLNCRFFECLCSGIVPFQEEVCSHFQQIRKKFVLVHKYLESGHVSVVCFDDDYDNLRIISHNQPFFGKLRHHYIIMDNLGFEVDLIKDKSLINICKNVADFLSVGEYAMLNKSYFKASAWFEKAKNSASLGADIIDNY